MKPCIHWRSLTLPSKGDWENTGECSQCSVSQGPLQGLYWRNCNIWSESVKCFASTGSPATNFLNSHKNPFHNSNSIIRSLQSQDNVLQETSHCLSRFIPQRKLYTRDNCPSKEKISTGGTVFKTKWKKPKEASEKRKRKSKDPKETRDKAD